MSNVSPAITLTTFALANLSLLLIKRREGPPELGLDVTIWVPAAGFVLSLALVGFELVERLVG